MEEIEEMVDGYRIASDVKSDVAYWLGLYGPEYKYRGLWYIFFPSGDYMGRASTMDEARKMVLSDSLATMMAAQCDR